MKIKHQDSILHPAIMMIAMNKNTTSTKNINNIETSSDSEQENDLVEYHNLQSVKSKQNKFKNHEYNSFKLNKGRPPMFPKINNQKVIIICKVYDYLLLFVWRSLNNSANMLLILMLF